MNRTLSAVILLLAIAGLVFAHGGEEHIMGTVTGLTDNSITVETTSRQVKTVAVTSKTKFTRNEAPATIRDFKIGDRIVIHAAKEDGKLLATTVRFGATKGAGHTH